MSRARRAAPPLSGAGSSSAVPSGVPAEKTYAQLCEHPGVGLCLSGGGYRAMLFHTGSLIRLNELGLPRHVHRVSSVSGGSVTAAQLALSWKLLFPDARHQANRRDMFTHLVQPLADLGKVNLLHPGWQAPRVLLNQAIGKLPFTGVQWGTAEVLTQNLRSQLPLLANATLADLPIPGPLPAEGPAAAAAAAVAPDELRVSGTPSFYINATNMRTGNLFIFCRRYLGESEVGYLHYPHQLLLARAVAASAGFPPFVSPVRIDLASAANLQDHAMPLAEQWKDTSRPSAADAERAGELAYAQYLQQHPNPPAQPAADGTVRGDLSDGGCGLTDVQRTFARSQSDLSLTDGGVYDNLGLEAVVRKFPTMFVSDAGQGLSFVEHPWTDYGMHGKDTMQLLDHQVRVLRKRQLVHCFTHNSEDRRDGAYWSIRGDVADEWGKPVAGEPNAGTDGSRLARQDRKDPAMLALHQLCDRFSQPHQQSSGFMSDLWKKLSPWSSPPAETTTLSRDLSNAETRFNGMSEEEVWALIDWGYVRTASAMAHHYEHQQYLQQGIPYQRFAPVMRPSLQKDRLDEQPVSDGQ